MKMKWISPCPFFCCFYWWISQAKKIRWRQYFTGNILWRGFFILGITLNWQSELCGVSLFWKRLFCSFFDLVVINRNKIEYSGWIKLYYLLHTDILLFLPFWYSFVRDWQFPTTTKYTQWQKKKDNKQSITTGLEFHFGESSREQILQKTEASIKDEGILALLVSNPNIFRFFEVMFCVCWGSNWWTG